MNIMQQKSEPNKFMHQAPRHAYRSPATLAVAAISLLFLGTEPSWSEPPSTSATKAAPNSSPAAADTPSGGSPGLVKTQSGKGRFVKTDEGFMVPYTATIPGTEVQFEMVPIAGGKFKMGSPESEKGRKSAEGPQFEVTVDPFWMGKFEITWSEYREFMKVTDVFKGFEGMKPSLRQVTKANQADAVTSPSNLYDPTFTFRNGDKPRLPACTMSQFAAKQYTKWLSLLTGDFYRLPSEAEWEYACRAGTTTAYSFGDDPSQLGKYAWDFDNSGETTHEVGQKQPNPWGLYDMYGNVSEWVLDQYLPEGYKKFGGKPTNWKDAIVWPSKLYPRVLRGGSWDADAADCRSASRRPSNDQDWREIDPNSPKSPWWFTEPDALGVGFRVIRPLKPAPTTERSKYWDADLQSIAEDAKDRVDQGRGAQGIVDRDLPAAIKKLDAERKAPAGK
jgi:formylglycine-generating enzyme required for sulfatase activity